VPTIVNIRRPGIRPIVARTSVSINPECSMDLPLGPWTEALAYAVARSTTTRPPTRCESVTGIVSSLMRSKASPDPKW